MKINTKVFKIINRGSIFSKNDLKFITTLSKLKTLKYLLASHNKSQVNFLLSSNKCIIIIPTTTFY